MATVVIHISELKWRLLYQRISGYLGKIMLVINAYTIKTFIQNCVQWEYIMGFYTLCHVEYFMNFHVAYQNLFCFVSRNSCFHKIELLNCYVRYLFSTIS
jgi:hypothetical protein